MKLPVRTGKMPDLSMLKGDLQALAWLAGLLEGEGCFTAGVASPSARIVLHMADRDVVERAARLLGGEVSLLRPATEKHKAMWRTEVGSVAAREAMELLLPLMGERRSSRIRELLANPGWGRRDGKHRGPVGQRKLNEEQVKAVLRLSGLEPQSRIAYRFGVGQGTISKIVSGHRYKEVS